MVRCWKKLALGSKNDKVDSIRRFGSGRSPHQWYLLKSKKYKKGGADFTFLEITKALILWCEVKFICENGRIFNQNNRFTSIDFFGVKLYWKTWVVYKDSLKKHTIWAETSH